MIAVTVRWMCLAAATTVLTATSAAGQEAVPQELTLEQVLRGAARQHPLVDAARARVRAAEGARTTAGALGNPVFTFQVENAPFPGQSRPAGLVTESSMLATLPLESIWQRGPRVRRANEGIAAATAELATARRDVALAAAQAFDRVALAQLSVRTAGELETGLDTLVRFTRARLAEGTVAEGDLIRIEVERDRVVAERVLQQAELVRARAALLPFLDDSTRGRALGGLVVAVTIDTTELFAPLPAAPALAARSLTLRSDIAAARARSAAARAEVGYQRTLFTRQLGATFGSKNTGGLTSMIAGFSIPLPLFDRNRGGVQRATAEREAADAELVWAERRAMAEIAGAYEAATLLSDQAGRLRRGFLTRAEQSRQVAVAAYQDGAAPLLQVIDATRTLGEARSTYYRLIFASRQALLELRAAVGLDLLAPHSLRGDTTP